MTSQKKIFLESEGDGWLARNRIDTGKMAARIAQDPVLKSLKTADIQPHSVLEIGCGDGWRLAAMRALWPQAKFTGIDPSRRAAAGAPDGVEILEGTADDLPFGASSFDLVMFGFCLYLCDRQDLFRIAAEADRVLDNGGTMIVYDFYTEAPYRNRYVHHEGVYSYKMDYSRLFTWSPAYTMIHRDIAAYHGMDAANPDNMTGVFLLKKNIAAGWPDNPWS